MIDLLHRHFEATRSPVATRILASWPAGAGGSFFKVMPRELQLRQPQAAAGRTVGVVHA